MKNLLLTLALTLGLTLTASAQNYYSTELLANNSIITGATNLIAANYAPSAGWVKAKANGVFTVSLTTAQIGTVVATNANVVLTFAGALDEYALANRYIASNNTFTVTALASPLTNSTTGPYYTWNGNVTNPVAGGGFFKLITVSHANTANQLRILSARAGYYP